MARIELDAVPTLKGSHLKELDAAARAFNSMVGALRLFSRYAPAKLVRRLIVGGVDAIPSERRTVTVLFTDIAGFTAAAETMPAEAAAALLNAHHTLVIACVEEEGGTVDKLIGDGLLAFWNAPDHPDRPCRPRTSGGDRDPGQAPPRQPGGRDAGLHPPRHPYR